MRKIDKGPEPPSWTQRRKTPGALYEATDDLRLSLIKEQGYLCAYCQRRILFEPGRPTDTRIEHVKSRKTHTQLQLDYRNMVLCCDGNLPGGPHCDRSKGERDLELDLFRQEDIDTLRYSSKDGTIKSVNEDYDAELNTILNLNQQTLRRNRVGALDGVIETLGRRGKYEWTKGDISKMKMAFEEKDGKGRYREYNGIILWFLDRKLKKLAGKANP